MDMVRFGDQRRDLPGSPGSIHGRLIARSDIADSSRVTAVTGVRIITVAQMGSCGLVGTQALLHPPFEIGIFTACNIAGPSVRGEIVSANFIH